LGETGIIFYTDNTIRNPIRSTVRDIIAGAGLPVVSCSLGPINLGENVVVDGVRSYPTMVKQILTALKLSKTKYVFFCEHDVLYHPSHFEFVPKTDSEYYYNINNWRWDYPNDRAIQYDGLTSLSMMCCNREIAIKHYELRMRLIEEQQLDKKRGREPRWARRFGYEPGTKRMLRGGITDEKLVTCKSEFPIFEIWQKRKFTQPNTTLESFKHKPKNWREVTLDKIPYWNDWNLWNLV
jgi:hypothetical protein